jgi:hypothetical protein
MGLSELYETHSISLLRDVPGKLNPRMWSLLTAYEADQQSKEGQSGMIAKNVGPLGAVDPTP